MSRIKMGLIGLGNRGYGMLDYIFSEHPEVEIVAVCDVYEDRCDRAAELLEKKGFATPVKTTNYKDIIANPGVEAVLLCTSWENHINICIETMEAGKYIASEVGGSYSIHDCWRLVDTYERTKVPCMFLENCCYGRDEMMILNMAQQGVLGKIVHCEGGYKHDLREEISFGKENRHYRLANYLKRNAENYPTHEIGPIAKILGINRGNRMLTLTSVASKAEGLKEFIKEHKADDAELMNATFQQGDIVNTIITCAGGETILITLDTTLPRYYSRGFAVHGTKGMYTEDNKSLFLDGKYSEEEHFRWMKNWNNVEEYREEYEHPMWKQYLSDGVKEKGHDGIDWLVFCDFVNAVKNKTEVPIDVYDMAAWMSISVLSEESIAMGGQPVAIPDFTNGAWIKRK